MPSRQGRLDTTYFSQSQKSTPARTGNGSQRQSQTQKSNGRRRVERSEEEEEDSEGSEGMNAIRMSESPKRKKLNGENEVVDLISDNEVEEEGKGNGIQETEAKAAASSSRSTPLELVNVDDEAFEVNSPAPILPETSRLKQVATSASNQSTAVPSVPKKRVDLTSGTLAYPLFPVPTTFTRLGAIPEASTPVSKKRLFPYIELKKWTEEQKALYVQPSPPTSSRQSKEPELPDNLTAFLGPDMAEIPPIPVSMPTVYEFLDSDEDILPIPPPKKRSLLSVEIPRRSQSSQNGSKPSSSSRTQRDTSQRKDQGMDEGSKRKKGKEVAGSDSEGDCPKPTKSSTRGKISSHTEISDEESEEDRPSRISRKDKGKGKARVQDDQSDDDSESDRRGKSIKPGKQKSKHTDHRTKKPKRKERQPSLTRREYLDELKLDESTRFKTESRLRKKKETPQQRILRKLKDKRNGIIRSDTTSEDSEEDSDVSSDSAADSRGLRRSESFIASDGGNEHAVVLPHEFSSNSAQTPEFKFKVVFQYFTLLAVCGTDILPLKGGQKEYFVPQLRDWRRKMEGHKESRVRSQIWPSNYVKALQTYPEVATFHLDVPEEHCLACNRTNYKSSYRLELRGNPYNPDTYEPLPTAKQKRKIREAKRKAAKKKAKRREEQRRQRSETPSQGSDSTSDEGTTSEEEDLIRQKDDILLGPHCRKRSILFHSMAHWEWILWNRVQNYYHDLLRAKSEEIDNDSDASPSESESDISDDERDLRKEKRKIRRDQTRLRVKRLRGSVLPNNPRDADAVQEWMDRQKYVLNEWKWLENLEDQSKRLEFDRNKDE